MLYCHYDIIADDDNVSVVCVSSGKCKAGKCTSLCEVNKHHPCSCDDDGISLVYTSISIITFLSIADYEYCCGQHVNLLNLLSPFTGVSFDAG